MSRIGNAHIIIPKESTVTVDGTHVVITGPKGTIPFDFPEGITGEVNGESLVVKRTSDARTSRALHGFSRALLASHVTGVTKGWTKTLELSGVGYRVAMSGDSIVLTVGFSHSVTIAPPERISFQIVEGKIIVSGINKQEVGQIAATIRATKKPEPYKGKGIKYAGEYIRKKAGKAAKAVGGATSAK